MSYILHFLRKFLGSKLGLVAPTNIQCYHGNKEETTLTKVIFEHPPWRPICMQNMKGGQKFSFSTFLDSYRELLLTVSRETYKPVALEFRIELEFGNVFFLYCFGL